MKKNLVVAVVFACVLSFAACSKYKSFNEEAGALNEQYKVIANDVFKKSNSERADAIKKAQQQYDAAFSVIAKKWKTDGDSEHLNFQEMFCKETVTDPYNKEIDNIIDKYNAEFVSVMKESVQSGNTNSDAITKIGTKIGTDVGFLNVKFKNLAKTNECTFSEANTKNMIERMMANM